jgi:hypothetical protein
MKHVAPHEISGPKSARPHGGIPSPGAEQRRAERPMGGFWPRIYVVKKGHLRSSFASSRRPAGCLLELTHGLDEGPRDAKSPYKKSNSH